MSPSVSACRLQPPDGVAPISAICIRRDHRRSPFTRSAVTMGNARSSLPLLGVDDRILRPAHGCAYNAHIGGPMKPGYNLEARKRPVNLTLNEDLVKQAKGMTDNLSGVVESLLSDFVAQEQRHRLAKAKALETTIAVWNDFNVKIGSFA